MSGDLFPSPRVHDPGGQSAIKAAAGMDGDALFGGPGDCYRYRLCRRWGDAPSVLFVMMNPSTADARIDDPTIAKITRMVRLWGGYGSLMVGNVFAYRATDQGRLAEVDDPIGPDNDQHLLAMARDAALVVFAYGTPKVPRLRTRGPAVARMLAGVGIEPHALRIGGSGHPWHPLYLPDATQPQPWRTTP